MMLFTPMSAAYIKARKKWQTRRLWLNARVKVGNIYYCQLNLKAESRFAVVFVTQVEEWDGETISEEDAIAEGFDSPSDFLSAYKDLNRSKWDDPNRTHYAICFEILEVMESIPDVPPLSFFTGDAEDEQSIPETGRESVRMEDRTER